MSFSGRIQAIENLKEGFQLALRLRESQDPATLAGMQTWWEFNIKEAVQTLNFADRDDASRLAEIALKESDVVSLSE